MKKGEIIKSLLNLLGNLFPNAIKTTFSTSYFYQYPTKELLFLLYAARHTLIYPDQGGCLVSFKTFFIINDQII
jgi:hypothetical protein